MKIYREIFLLGAAAWMALTQACSGTGCFDNRSAIPRAEFYSIETGKSQSVTGLEISGIGAPNDSVLIAPRQTVTDFYLPMRSEYSSTSWCLHYMRQGISSPEFNDTITFDYDSRPYFASEECGAMYSYLIRRLTATHHVIDSIAILDSLITNVDIVRIRIYLPELPPVETSAPGTPGEEGEDDATTPDSSESSL